MRLIYADENIKIPEGYTEYLIDTHRDIDLTFTAMGNSSVFVMIKKVGKLRLRTFTEDAAQVTYLFWNELNHDLIVEESHEVMRDASLKIAYGEVNNHNLSRKSYVALRQQGAHTEISSASLVSDKKEFDIDVVNFAKHTTAQMTNYSVVLNGGAYLMDCNGAIAKAASGSESHQTSRALCFDDGQNTVILPKLCIDENDVQASHATSVGRVDEDQLYYMMTRGLTLEQCTALISTGYLMPITEVIDNDELRNKLKAELEGKIASLCSM